LGSELISLLPVVLLYKHGVNRAFGNLPAWWTNGCQQFIAAPSAYTSVRYIVTVTEVSDMAAVSHDDKIRSYKNTMSDG